MAHPCFWFESQATAAAARYAELLPETRIVSDNGFMVELSMGGHPVHFMNAGPKYRPNPSISLFVFFETDEALDCVHAGLVEGGSTLMPLDAYPWATRYAWIADRWGVNWQLMRLVKPLEGPAIVPALLFTGAQAGRAEEAMNRYAALLPNSHIEFIKRYAEGDDNTAGLVSHARFVLDGRPFIASESGYDHGFAFDEGVSLMRFCADQAEIDRLWNALTAEGGEESRCGWLRDPHGVSWQIVPTDLGRWLSDPVHGAATTQAMFGMRKLVIDELRPPAGA